MYGEPFGIPEPSRTIFTCWYQGGRVFRGGVTFERGAGKVFYFQPGHETIPTVYLPLEKNVLNYAGRWAFIPVKVASGDCSCVVPIEPVE